MKKIYILIIQNFFLIGCSNTGQTVLTEFKNSDEERASVSYGYTPAVQSGNFSSLFEVSVPTIEKSANSQRNEEIFGKAKEQPRDKKLNRNESNSPFLDTENAKDLINRYRRANNLKPLKLNPELTAAAKSHAKDLSNWDRISHYGSDGSNPLDRISRTGYKARISAENVGTGSANFKHVFEGWTKNPGQNKNLLLSEASEMGLALIQAPKTEFKSFWTLVLSAPL